MLEQRTDDWFAARMGKVTASRIADVMAKTKTGHGAGRANYHAQLVAERLTGTVADSFTNAAMIWGIETEAQRSILIDQGCQYGQGYLLGIPQPLVRKHGGYRRASH